jgi:hypothetical protein
MKKITIIGLCILFSFLLINIVNAEKVLEVYEGDLINIKLNLSDPDGDEIKFKFSLPLTEDGKWQTRLGDNGTYYSSLNITDNKSSTVENIKLIVHKLDLPQFNKTYSVREKEKLIINIPKDAEFNFSLPKGAKYQNNKITWTPKYNSGKAKINIFMKYLYKFNLIKKLNLEQETTFKIPYTMKVRNVELNEELEIKVKNVNRAPNITKHPDEIKIKEGEILSLSYTAEDPDKDFLFATYSGLINKNKQVIDFDKAGNHSVNISVSDGMLKVSKEVKVYVENVNRPPKFSGKTQLNLNEGEKYNITLDHYDLDRDNVNISLKDGKSFARKEGWNIYFEPSFDFVKAPLKDRNEIIELTLDDGKDISVQNITINVKDINRNFNITSYKPGKKFVVSKGQVIDFEVNAQDPDGGNLTYYWGNKEGSQSNKYSLKVSKEGVHKLKVKVSDGEHTKKFQWKFLVK